MEIFPGLRSPGGVSLRKGPGKEYQKTNKSLKNFFTTEKGTFRLQKYVFVADGYLGTRLFVFFCGNSWGLSGNDDNAPTAAQYASSVIIFILSRIIMFIITT